MFYFLDAKSVQGECIRTSSYAEPQPDFAFSKRKGRGVSCILCYLFKGSMFQNYGIAQ